MSIVIATKDILKIARAKTRDQELKIDKNGAYEKWQLNDITKPNPIMKVLGLVAFPIVAFWGLIMLGVGFAMSFVVFLLKILGKIFR